MSLTRTAAAPRTIFFSKFFAFFHKHPRLFWGGERKTKVWLFRNPLVETPAGAHGQLRFFHSIPKPHPPSPHSIPLPFPAFSVTKSRNFCACFCFASPPPPSHNGLFLAGETPASHSPDLIGSV